MRLALILLFLTGCGTTQNEYFASRHNNVRNFTSFQQWTGLFKEEGLSRNQVIEINDLTIKFADIPRSKEGNIILGRCILSESPTILINQQTWSKSNLIYKWIVIAHELGHCVLHRAHTDEKLSIMNTYAMSSYDYMENEGALLNELFDPSTYGTFSLDEEDKACDGLIWRQ